MNTVSHFRESEKKWTNQGLWSYLRENSIQLDFCWQYRFFILWPPTSDSAGVPRPPKSDSAEAGPGMSAMASVQRQVHWPSHQRLWKSVENSVFLPPGCLCGLGWHWLRKTSLLPSLPSFWGLKPRASCMLGQCPSAEEVPSWTDSNLSPEVSHWFWVSLLWCPSDHLWSLTVFLKEETPELCRVVCFWGSGAFCEEETGTADSWQ